MQMQASQWIYLVMLCIRCAGMYIQYIPVSTACHAIYLPSMEAKKNLPTAKEPALPLDTSYNR